MGRHKTIDPDGIDPDALTTDPDVRVRQLNLEMYSARRAAEDAGVIYARAIKRMRSAEINMSRAVRERQQTIHLGSNNPSRGDGNSVPR